MTRNYTSPRTIVVAFVAAVTLSACGGSDEPVESVDTAVVTSTTELTAAEAEPVAAPSSSEAPAADAPTAEPDVAADADETTDSTLPADSSIDDVEESEEIALADDGVCETVVPSAIHYVDVAFDDPDGGLNVRSGPGVDNEILQTLPRGIWVQPTSTCSLVGTTEWWEVDTLLWGQTGWVSSDFLTTDRDPILAEGTTAVDDFDGVTFSSVDELSMIIANAYREDPGHDLVITPVGEPVGIDAQGYELTLDVTPYRDDSVYGERITFVVRSNPADPDQPDEIVSASSRAICRRGQMHTGCA